ncbi:hypothetical protein BLOT_000680, partial [Blomia tropicalis]
LCLPSGANDDHDDSDGVEFRLVPYSSGKRKEKKKMIVRDEFQFQNNDISEDDIKLAPDHITLEHLSLKSSFKAKWKIV